jgi:GntR family transcriptional regulator
MEQMVLTRLFLADSKPAIYIRDHFSSSLICAEYSEDDLNNFLFDFLGKSCNIKLSYSLSEIVPTIADTEISKQLNVAESAPLMKCQDTHFNKNNMPIVFSEVYYKDEFIRFHLMRKYS